MSEHRRDTYPTPARASTLEKMARVQNATELRDPTELAADIWESHAELDEFLGDLRCARLLEPERSPK